MRRRPNGNVEDYEFNKDGGETTYLQWEIVRNVLMRKQDNLGDKYSAYV